MTVASDRVNKFLKLLIDAPSTLPGSNRERFV